MNMEAKGSMLDSFFSLFQPYICFLNNCLLLNLELTN